MMANDEGRIRNRIVVDAHGKNDKIGLLMVECEERRQFLNARCAPACPEVEQDHMSAVVGQVNRGSAVRNGEIWSNFSGLRGMRTATARGQKSERK